MPSFWQGVLPAITTPCLEDGSVDHAFLAHHVEQMMRAGRMAEAAPLYHWFLPLLRDPGWCWRATNWRRRMRRLTGLWPASRYFRP